MRGLLPDGRRQDEFVKVFDAPSLLDKGDRQPVQQFWMRWWLTQMPEIVRRRHDSAPKMLLPDAIDDDTSRQRVVGTANPLGQGP